MIFWNKQNKKSTSGKIDSKILELSQSENIVEAFTEILDDYPIQETTLNFEKKLMEWEIDKILDVGKALSSLEEHKQFIKFIKQFFVCKEEPQTVIFSLQILSNIKNEKIIECFYNKFAEIFPLDKVNAIFSIAVKKEHPDADTIILMSGACAVPFLWLWQKTIKNRFTKVRLETIKILGEFSWQQAKVASLLAGSLEDKKSEIAKAAAVALAKLGKYAVPSLIKMLVQKDSRTRTLTAWSLGKIGSEAGMAIPYLVSCLSDEDVKVVRNAKWALENMGESVKEEMLRSLEAVNDSLQRISLLEIISNFKPSEDIVKVCIGLLNNKEDDSLEMTIRALGKMGTSASCALPKLKNFLKSKLPSLKLAAIFAISQIEQKNQDLHPMLFQLCADESPKIRQEAMQLAVNVANTSKKTHRIVVESLDDKDNKVKKSAIESLAGLEGSEINNDIIKKLISYLEENDRDLSLAIMKTMVDLEMATNEAIGPLIHILQSEEDEGMQTYALLSLKVVGERSVKPLMSVLNKNTKLRKQISNTLVDMGEVAVEKLLLLLKGNNANIRKSATKILEKIGQPAIPGLVALLKEEDFWIKKSATIALINIKENVSENLVELLRSDNKEWRQSALAVLKEIHIDAFEQ